MVKPVQGGLVEKLVLDDRERRNSVGQRILFVHLEFLVVYDAARCAAQQVHKRLVREVRNGNILVLGDRHFDHLGERRDERHLCRQ